MRRHAVSYLPLKGLQNYVYTYVRTYIYTYINTYIRGTYVVRDWASGFSSTKLYPEKQHSRDN